jgi:hypothetical protein
MRNFQSLMSLGKHVVSAACLLIVLATTTSAYSIIMRGGKRIEIPAQFSVTNMTLTYEAAPGFWITLQMAAIDIRATERANNEMPGSLLARAKQVNEPSSTVERTDQAPASTAARSVTNQDLESFQRSRLASERAYEQRLKDQGLPPLAIIRAEAAAEAERFWNELAQKREAEEAREKAAQLQAQIAALNAKVDYLESRDNGYSSNFPGVITGYGGFPFFGGWSSVNPALFRVPFGLPIGGAFGTFNVPFGSHSRFHGFRRNIILAPRTHIGGRHGFRGGPHRGPRPR